MASGIGVIGLDITDVDTVASGGLQFALGARGAVDSQSGVREYIYVQFPVSAALTVGDVVLINGVGASTAATTTTTTPGNAAGRRVGVAVTAVASSATPQYGWVQIYGPGSVRVLASAAATTILNSTATAGVLDDDATAGAEVIDGVVLNVANGGATAAVACVLNYPFVGRTV